MLVLSGFELSYVSCKYLIYDLASSLDMKLKSYCVCGQRLFKMRFIWSWSSTDCLSCMLPSSFISFIGEMG